MKRLVPFFFAVILGMLAQTGYSQQRASLQIYGDRAGTIDTLSKDEVTYVDVQKAARKLGANVVVFARSKQTKVSAPGFTALFTADSADYMLNGQPTQLTGPVQAVKNRLFVPVDFFLLPSFQQAVSKEISWTGTALQAERTFDFERTDAISTTEETQLAFDARRTILWRASQPNGHTVEVVFPDFVVKRDENLRLKTDFLASASVRQEPRGAVLRAVLGKQGKKWTVESQDKRLLFRVSAKPLAPILTAETDLTSAVDLPEEPENATEELAAANPSVLDEEVDDGFEEMEVPAGAVISAKQGPVIKSAGQSTALSVSAAPETKISAVHKKMRIMVDPGHGGKDSGAVRVRVREKDINLAVAKELTELLKKNGFQVKMTRTTDVFIPLSDRSKMSNKFKADLFVSVHANAARNRTAHGFEVYFRSEKATDKEAADTAALENEAMQYEEVHYNFVEALLQSLAKNEYVNESSKLAGYVRNSIEKQSGTGIAIKNTSVRQANFYVLKGVQSPAILVELGYLSNQADRERLVQKAVQKKMAQGIYNGIHNYAQKEGWIN